MSPLRRTFRLLSIALTPFILAASLLVAVAPTQIGASSHREAPLISSDPDADTTDVYAFVSRDRTASVTLIGNWIPFEHPDGGPNYYQFSPNVLYEIHVDNVGDGKSHITYQFSFKTTTQNPATFLYNTGAITSLTDSDWNVRQTYTMTEVVTPVSGPVVTKVLGTNLPAPPVNIGSKSTPNYDSLADSAVCSIQISGVGGPATGKTCNTRSTAPGANDIKVFAGQRDDPFWVDLGSIFDLLSLRGQASPIGYPGGPTVGIDGLSGFNVHSIAIQVPINRLTTNNDPVIGIWATSSRQTTRVLTGDPLNPVTYTGLWVQVSRLGMPLVNEVVIPRGLKDAFNTVKPEQDLSLYSLLQPVVEDPELGTRLCSLYGVPLPRVTTPACHTHYTGGTPRTGRADIFDIFLTGIKLAKAFVIHTPGGDVTLLANTIVNRPTKGTNGSGAGIQPSEALRLNTSFKPGTGGVCPNTPDYQQGLLGGDACGFPNGRRLADNATYIELLAVGGAAWQVTTGDTTFSFNPALANVLTDSVTKNDKAFDGTFPYLASPHQGQEWYHQSVNRMILPIISTGGSTVYHN